ncbi:MAG: thermonuclease family protein [Patescibacteria group bacterium]
MNKFLLVLIGAMGIGIGLGITFIVPSVKDKEVAQASAGVVLEEETEVTSEGDEGEPMEELFDVIKVVDGDTIAISMNEKSETIRLIGIDTPETVDSRVEVQCFGGEASEKAKALLSGRKVSLEMDAEEGERDKYDRLLAYVYRDDGLFFNKYMIEQGFAHEYTYDDPYKYQKEFKAAEASAKVAQRGLWAPDACSEPEVKGQSTVSEPKKVETVPAALEPPALSAGQAEQSTALSQEPQQTQQNPPPPPPPPQPPPTQSTNSNYTCSSNTYNCSDFKTHAEAQSVFDMCGGTGNDVHKLDSNKDGEACEALP